MENKCLENSNSLTYAYLLKKYGLVISWEEAGEELGVYWENIRRMCAQGEIPIGKIGRSWLLTTKALADFIDYGPASKWGKADTEKTPKKPKQKRGFKKYVWPETKEA